VAPIRVQHTLVPSVPVTQSKLAPHAPTAFGIHCWGEPFEPTYASRPAGHTEHTHVCAHTHTVQHTALKAATLNDTCRRVLTIVADGAHLRRQRRAHTCLSGGWVDECLLKSGTTERRLRCRLRRDRRIATALILLTCVRKLTRVCVHTAGGRSVRITRRDEALQILVHKLARRAAGCNEAYTWNHSTCVHTVFRTACAETTITAGRAGNGRLATVTRPTHGHTANSALDRIAVRVCVKVTVVHAYSCIHTVCWGARGVHVHRDVQQYPVKLLGTTDWHE
jgi:hypothetical protein